MIARITRAYTRHYTDNLDTKAYVEWVDHRGRSGRTEGDAYDYHGVTLPEGDHMGALFDRAIREGITIGHETW